AEGEATGGGGRGPLLGLTPKPENGVGEVRRKKYALQQSRPPVLHARAHERGKILRRAGRDRQIAKIPPPLVLYLTRRSIPGSTSGTIGIPLDPSGFKRYFIPPDTPFWFEVIAGGRSIFHSRAVRGEEWIQLKSGEVMTVRYPFKAR